MALSEEYHLAFDLSSSLQVPVEIAIGACPTD
jgi:hypothetical protein